MSAKLKLAFATFAQLVSFYVIWVYWPKPAALFAFILLMLVFTPLMLLFCLDILREYNRTKEENRGVRIILSLPLTVLAATSFVLAIGFFIAFIFMVYEKPHEILLLPVLISLVCIFLFAGVYLTRTIFLRKSEYLHSESGRK